ncbi:hypothetical protein DDD_2980 [Nonlabens dokdonensis DSW-6]|uniref:Uncharacterized protein n=1 Tax=Nonlabens dokdonensis (strain DSM 17205 / KCTC 12402 / DSW-6) TaxID=592029 RepID=L7WCY2_NONDD|nr:hypothetical protein DDD_2980 [Nonlabens dokdonensis DSW-6]
MSVNDFQLLINCLFLLFRFRESGIHIYLFKTKNFKLKES